MIGIPCNAVCATLLRSHKKFLVTSFGHVEECAGGETWSGRLDERGDFVKRPSLIDAAM